MLNDSNYLIDMKTSIIALSNSDARRALVIANRTQNAFAAGILTASIHDLKNELQKRVVKVTFLKKSGEITTRMMTTQSMIAKKHINGNGMSGDAKNVVVAWDCEAEPDAYGNKWRSFRFEKLIAWE